MQRTGLAVQWDHVRLVWDHVGEQWDALAVDWGGTGSEGGWSGARGGLAQEYVAWWRYPRELAVFKARMAAW